MDRWISFKNESKVDIWNSIYLGWAENVRIKSRRVRVVTLWKTWRRWRWEPRVNQKRFIRPLPFYSDYHGVSRADCTFHSMPEYAAKTESSDRKVHIDCNSKCSDNLLRPFVVWRDCTHAQSVRENGNRAKWIRSLRKSAREEGRGREDGRGGTAVCLRER